MEAFQQEANYISQRLAAAGTTRDKVDRAVNSASTWTSNTEMTLLEGAAQMFGELLCQRSSLSMSCRRSS